MKQRMISLMLAASFVLCCSGCQDRMDESVAGVSPQTTQASTTVETTTIPTTTPIPSSMATTTSTSATTVAKPVDEASVYAPLILQSYATQRDPSMLYALFDIDGDGVRELLLSKGTYTFDSVREIYTIVDGQAQHCGGITGNLVAFLYTQEGALYTSSCHMSCQTNERIDKIGQTIQRTTVMQLEHVENYRQYGTPVREVSQSTLQLLQPGQPTVGTVPDGFSLPSYHNGYGHVATTDGQSLNLRSAPSLQSTVIQQLPAGTALAILGQGNGWYYVQAETSFGYVASYLVTPVLSPSEDTAAFYVGQAVSVAMEHLPNHRYQEPSASDFWILYSESNNYTIGGDSSGTIARHIGVMNQGKILDGIDTTMRCSDIMRQLQIPASEFSCGMNDAYGFFYTFDTGWNTVHISFTAESSDPNSRCEFAVVYLPPE